MLVSVGLISGRNYVWQINHYCVIPRQVIIFFVMLLCLFCDAFFLFVSRFWLFVFVILSCRCLLYVMLTILRLQFDHAWSCVRHWNKASYKRYLTRLLQRPLIPK